MSKKWNRSWLYILTVSGVLALIVIGLYGFAKNRPAIRTSMSKNMASLAALFINDDVQGTYVVTRLVPTHGKAASGPLHISNDNPRYFEDGSGNIVYLTGSHTWSNLQDNGGSNPPPAFDYSAYLDFLETNNHNFFRLWHWEESRWTVETADDEYWFNPTPYQRTGPGDALDGKPRFDLTKFNQVYFDRLRQRVVEADARGIYVAIMLFNGWSVSDDKGGWSENNPWRGHPYNTANNVNGIDGDINEDNSGEEVHELRDSQVIALQEAYVRQVIDTVNDLDNVLFEISNESHGDSQEWQYRMINLIKDYEATQPKQHPVGMTVEWPDGDNGDLFASPADWVSPNLAPPADGSKVILLDTDHICGVCGDRQWVWESFVQGYNPIFMDGYDGAGYGVGGAGFNFNDPNWVSLRRNLGYTLAYAQRINLSSAVPRPGLASTGFALANDKELLAYLPLGGSVQVDLSTYDGEFAVEWLNPENGELFTGGTIVGGAPRNLVAPFSGDAVLLIYTAKPAKTPISSPGTSMSIYHVGYVPFESSAGSPM